MRSRVAEIQFLWLIWSHQSLQLTVGLVPFISVTNLPASCTLWFLMAERERGLRAQIDRADWVVETRGPRASSEHVGRVKWGTGWREFWTRWDGQRDTLLGWFLENKGCIVLSTRSDALCYGSRWQVCFSRRSLCECLCCALKVFWMEIRLKGLLCLTQVRKKCANRAIQKKC